ncbi:hypothetical protein [Nannocystis sp. SCPEA4]|uniref:hypothetical protein n=1 Tax=Nannocystis sp. SCPEA4 TaxID=2996787 RepID=UPI002270F33F|nr:hypothetical protein [Nannocystis sp. SCPEA4]MCY1060126.1 hypothetical protein [Nannocystis sp. SCPEA4]
MKFIAPLLCCSLVACQVISDLGHERESAIVTSSLAIVSEDQELALDSEREGWAADPTASCEVDGDDNQATGRFNRSFAFAMAANEADPVAFGVAIELSEEGVWDNDIGLHARGKDGWRPAEDCRLELGEWDYEARFFEFSADCTFTLEGEADITVVGDLRAERCFDRSAVSIELAKSIVSDGVDVAVDLGQALVEDPVGFAKTIALLPLYAAGGH